MKYKRKLILCTALLWLFAVACGADDTIYLETADASEAAYETETSELPEESVPNSDSGGASTEEFGKMCYVYICGAILHPGVYEVPDGSRIYEVVHLAGGLAEDASDISVNQAEEVYDGQMIFVPTLEEAEAGISTDAIINASGGTVVSEAKETDSRININTASLAELMTLSGIGQAKAESIVSYREAHGGFSSVEEIMNVDGIKEGLYNRIKDDIRVN